MGGQILQLSKQFPELEVAGALESLNNSALGETVLNGSLKIVSDLSTFQNKCDVLIDFSTPMATLGHLRLICDWKKTGIVIGTTGFNPAQKIKIKKYAERTPVLISPNMSVGVNLLLEVAALVAQRLPLYDVEIIESHHNQKKDAPSGTALALAKSVADAFGRSEKNFVYGRKGELGARSPQEIGIHAVRAGDIVGEHHVLFVGSGEKIELVHQASSRDAFAGGALRAAVWLSGKGPGLYSMQNVLQPSKVK